MLKQLEWIGNSKKNLLEFPEEVRKEIGFALFVAQLGGTHESVKLFKGHGSGVYEIVSNYNANAYRAIYIVNLDDKVYVLHAFQKKSKRNIKLPREELVILEERLKRVRRLKNEQKRN